MPSFTGFLRAAVVATAATCAHAGRALGLPPSLGGVIVSHNLAVSAGPDHSEGACALLGSEDAAGAGLFKQVVSTTDGVPSVSFTLKSESTCSNQTVDADSTNELSAMIALQQLSTSSGNITITAPTKMASTAAGVPARTGRSAQAGSAYQTVHKKLAQERAKLTQERPQGRPKLTQEPENLKVGHNHLKRSAARTREKLIMRDTDVILVTFPKSATHWLASVVSMLAFSGTVTEGTAGVQDIYYFHGMRVFWLLPDAWNGVDENGAGIPNTEDIPDAVYDAINGLPESTPRIFLSHMPTEFFEYSPTSKTTILCEAVLPMVV